MNANKNMGEAAPLVEVTRGELVESLHCGVIAVLDGEGKTKIGLGDIESRTWYRSAAKPFQTIALVESGAADYFNFTPQEIAVITASHSGEDIHLKAVESILQKIGLSEAYLLCGAHMPFDETSAKQLRASGQKPRALHNNCSGKHAGMLAFARFTSQPLENYIDPQHPIQRRIRDVLGRFADIPQEFADDQIKIAIDGCSAPVFGSSIRAMARSYARLVNAGNVAIESSLAVAAERVVEAMVAHPEMIGGTEGRLDTDVMRVTEGAIISKVGAEGVQLLGVRPGPRHPSGLGIAIKIQDGDSRRARDPVVIETLRQLDLLTRDELDQLSAYSRSTLYNHRKIEVGDVRTCFKL